MKNQYIEPQKHKFIQVAARDIRFMGDVISMWNTTREHNQRQSRFPSKDKQFSPGDQIHS